MYWVGNLGMVEWVIWALDQGGVVMGMCCGVLISGEKVSGECTFVRAVLD
jgi:hypothetical protein